MKKNAGRGRSGTRTGSARAAGRSTGAKRRTGADAASFGSATPGRVPAARFKALCLELMDRVKETGTEYIVTKHGKPVARLVPYTAPEKEPLFGLMKGTVLQYDRPFDPIDGEYEIDRDER